MANLLLSPGTYTVGTGGDYADFYALALALGVQTGPYSASSRDMQGDFTFRVVGSFNQAESALMYIRRFNGYTLTVDCDSEHAGDPTDISRLITISGNKKVLRFGSGSVVNDSGELTISGLYCKALTHSTNNLDLICFWTSYVSGVSRNVTVENCMFDLNSHRASAISVVRFNASGTHVVKNCKLWGAYDTGGLYDRGMIYQGRWAIENCTFKSGSHSVGAFYGSGITARNNAIIDSPFEAGYGSTLDGGNASTETGEVEHDIVAANEFVTLDDTNESFLKPKSGGVIDTSGVAPTYANDDIAGLSRPGSDGLYSIGCHEFLTTRRPKIMSIF